MATHSCGKPVTVFVPRGFTYREVQYKCGQTGIDGYPVLCDDCAKEFNAQEYREDCAANGENIDEDY